MNSKEKNEEILTILLLNRTYILSDFIYLCLFRVINNVINDLLDPRRTGQATGQNTFHFQAPPM